MTDNMYQPPQPPMQPGAPSGQSAVSGLAVTSLILGILALPMTCLAGIPAIICGHMGLSRIKRSGGALRGGGMALAGLIMGYVGTALSLIAVPIILSLAMPVFSKIQEQAQITKISNDIRQVFLACELLSQDSEDWGFPESMQALQDELVEDGYVDDEGVFNLPQERMGSHIDDDAEGRLFILLTPGAVMDSLEADTPVLVSTVAFSRHKRIVVFADGSVEVIPEDEIHMPESGGGGVVEAL